MVHGMTVADQGAQVQQLRLELKQWEHTFAANNGGRKANKDDIKQNAEIAAKYKLYSRLKSQQKAKGKGKGEGSKDEGQAVRTTPAKRTCGASPKTDNIVIDTPSKPVGNQDSFSTPRSAHRNAAHLRPVDLDTYDSPSVLRKLFSPSSHARTAAQKDSPLPLRDALGPTPQRNGKALGLFDLMSSSTKSVTPSKRKYIGLDRVDEDPNLRTPTRNSTAMRDSSGEGVFSSFNGSMTPQLSRGHSHSPVSASRQYYLANFFATPTTRRLMSTMPEEEEEEEEGDILGDLGMSPLASAKTRRSPLFTQTRVSASGTGRQVSERMTRSLKKGPDERCSTTDLRPSPQKPRTPPTRKLAGKGLTRIVEGLKVLETEDFGDDYEALLQAEEDAEQHDPDNDEGSLDGPGEGRQRAWKKRGQKRTTRRVNMQPSRAKPKSEKGPPSTEHASNILAHAKHSHAQPDIYEDETATPRKEADRERKRDDKEQMAKESAQIDEEAASPVPSNTQHPQQSATGARKGRPVKAEAHVNYRALKIQRKAPGRGRGRFRRR